MYLTESVRLRQIINSLEINSIIGYLLFSYRNMGTQRTYNFHGPLVYSVLFQTSPQWPQNLNNIAHVAGTR